MKCSLSLLIVLIVVGSGLCQNESTPQTPISNLTTDPKLNCSDPTDRLNLQCINDDLKERNSSVLIVFIVTILSGLWGVYLTYYNSRFIGFVLTKVINQFSKDAYIQFGSFSISILSGKFMFRDFHYITTDYSLKINDGYFIFRWWRSYKNSKLIKESDLNRGHTRLSVVLHGVDYHQYNRNNEYNRLRNLFENKGNPTNTELEIKDKEVETPGKKNEVVWWRTLFPVIKINISYGRFIFGNRLLPNTQVISYTDSEFQYKTTFASNKDDLFMHVFVGKVGTVKVMFVPSVGYDPSFTPSMLGVIGIHNEPPPRKMGEGYTLFQSSDVDMKYTWDEPGKVTTDSVDLKNNEKRLSYPIWELAIKCGQEKKAILNYGPWADRQRDLLWKFFFPADYQTLKVNDEPIVGQQREPQSFRILMDVLDRAEIVVSFNEGDKVHGINVHTSKGSCIEIEIPMLVTKEGYSTNISGRLLFVDAFTTLQYNKLLSAETLQFNFTSHYPRVWNQSQTWDCDITAAKASVYFVFAHKDFFGSLMDDWSSKSSPDLLFFVPYSFNVKTLLKDFELLLPTNSYNWVDCLPKPKDNAYVGLCGKELSIDFSLPFEDFLPPTFSIPFKFILDHGELCIHLPASNSARSVLINLAQGQDEWTKNIDPECTGAESTHKIRKKDNWGAINEREWVKCWDVPGLELVLTYSWHPIVNTFQSEDMFRPPGSFSKRHSSFSKRFSTNDDKKSKSVTQKPRSGVTFDPTTLESDEIRVDLCMTPNSTLYLYGKLVDLLIAIKENYFGVDDMYTDFMTENPAVKKDDSASINTEVNPLLFRPLQVTLDIHLYDITGVLPVFVTSLFPCQPTVKLKSLTFEMDKNYHQTRLQLLLSTFEIEVPDKIADAERPQPISPLGGPQGRILLRDLQLRGHAMFSGAGLPVGAATIEYAWLLEVLVGPIFGKLSICQVQLLLDWAQTFLMLFKNSEYQLKEAFPDRTLPTGIVWDQTKKDGSTIDEGDVKYLMNRVKIDSVHLRLVEKTSAIDVLVLPITISNGNVQDQGILEAVSIIAEDVKIQHKVCKKGDEWLEGGEVRFGPIITQVTVATEDDMMTSLQDEFLRFHDKKTRRLDFLWDSDGTDGSRKTSPGMDSLLESVKFMKSWGCTFFTPLLTKDPTYYYKKHLLKAGDDDLMAAYNRQDEPTAHLEEVSLEDIDLINTDDQEDEDVFDQTMDFGMSLLSHGKRLLTRSLTSNKSTSSVRSTPRHQNVDQQLIVCQQIDGDQQELQIVETDALPAGVILMQDNSNEFTDALPPLDKTSANYLQPITAKEKREKFKRPSILKKRSLSNATCSFEEKEFDISGRDRSKTYSSQTVDRIKPPKSNNLVKMAPLSTSSGHMGVSRAVSTESNLYRSAESDFKSTSSLGSDVYFSAESDLENESAKKSKNVLDGGLMVVYVNENDSTTSSTLQPATTSSTMSQHAATSSTIQHLATSSARPESLEIGSKPSVVRKLELEVNASSKETRREEKDDFHEFPSKHLHENEAMFACYGSILTSLRTRESAAVDWLPDFVVSKRGIHPSVMVNKSEEGVAGRRKSSADVLDVGGRGSGNRSTNVKLHIKNSVDVQLSPYFLSTLQQFIDASIGMLKHKHPISVLNELREECISDAATKFSAQKKDLPQSPGINVQLCMDVIRINIVQATRGNDPVFNLRLNGLSPAPSLSVVSFRLDQFDFDAELNKKEDKLRMKIYHQNKENKNTEDQGVVIPAQMKCHSSIKSIALQLRSLSKDGLAPVHSCVTALSDAVSRSPFTFNEEDALDDVKMMMDSYHEGSNYKKDMLSPPKPWGWIMIEAGMKNLSADLTKIPGVTEDSGSEGNKNETFLETPSGNDMPGEHSCQGELNIDLLWLNVVAPTLPSQKPNRMFRTWNLLTAIAPSVSAWLQPADLLGGAIDKCSQVARTRTYSSISAMMTLALKNVIDDKNNLKEILGSQLNKHVGLTKKSKAVREDKSFLLCDALQRFLTKPENIYNVQQAINEELGIPALVTLEKGLKVLVGHWHEFVFQSEHGNVKGRRKKIVPIQNVSNPLSKENQIGVKYDGNLDIATILSKQTDQQNVEQQNVEPSKPRTNRTDAHIGILKFSEPETIQEDAPLITIDPLQRHISERSTHVKARDIVFEQQQGIYSWMQKEQRGGDLEAPKHESFHEVDSGLALQSFFSKFENTDLSNQESAQAIFETFLVKTGVHQTSVISSKTLVQSYCSGSLLLNVHLKNLRIDKHNADRMYSKESLSRKKRQHSSKRRKHQSSLRQPSRTWSRGKYSDKRDSTIFSCQGFMFKTSACDNEVQPIKTEDLDSPKISPKSKKSRQNNKNNNKKLEEKLLAEKNIKMTTLNVIVDCNIDVIKQRVDIALIRLVHQFVQCSDAIQQATTDMQVNKYTEGSISPDTGHKRMGSNISTTSMLSSQPSSSGSKPSILKRRHTSPIHRRTPSEVNDTTSVASSTSTNSGDIMQCWQILYKLVDMHSTEPGTSALHSPLIQDEFSYENERKLQRGVSSIVRNSSFSQPYVSMMILFNAQVRRVQLLAEVIDLKLNANVYEINASVSHTKKSFSVYKNEASSTLQAGLDKILCDITENMFGSKKTILTCNVNKSALDASTNHQRASNLGNRGSLRVGQIVIDLPQHAASLHDVVSRGSRHLSSHIHEFAQTPTYKQSFEVVDGIPIATPSTTTFGTLTPMTPSAITAIIDLSHGSSDVVNTPVELSFSLLLEGIEAGANILPSLRARYVTNLIQGSGKTGSDAEFTLTMPTHSLQFATTEAPTQTDLNPVSTTIDLPAISCEGEVKQQKDNDDINKHFPHPADGELQMKGGEFLAVSINIGSFEHTLTTDLLNQLIFLQEIFMSEVNEVIQKVSSAEKPVPLWSESSLPSVASTSDQSMLYQLQLQLEGIQITASTPSSNAVRLKTGTMVFELSNRVVRSADRKLQNIPKYLKLFGKAQVDLTLALGALIINNVYPEAEPEFQQMAYFTTRIGLQNSTQQSQDTGNTLSPPNFAQSIQLQDNNIILISLTRPVFFVQPTAFDKAILIFLAYKSAYEDWVEKRSGLEGNVRHATRQVVSAIQVRRAQHHSSTQQHSNLFLQLSVHDLGICLPVPKDIQSYNLSAHDELSSALVLTIGSTLINACYAKSLVTTGNFKGFCVRFADDFQTSWDDWSPSPVPGKNIVAMNSFVVPQGYYEICTDTTSYNKTSGVMARTSVNVVWQMKGIDVEFDTKIGAHFAQLIDTLTIITGQDGSFGRDSSVNDRLCSDSGSMADLDPMMSSFDDVIDSPSSPTSRKDRTRKIEQELNEVVRTVNDLRSLGAKPSIVEEQERKMHALELTLSSMFRRNFRNRLRRSSTKAKKNKKEPRHQSHSHSAEVYSKVQASKSTYSTLPTLRRDEQRISWNDEDSYDDDYDSTSTSQSDFDEADGRVFHPQPQRHAEDRNMSVQSQNTTQILGPEAELEMILDIKVEIDGGKIVCHPLKSSDTVSNVSSTSFNQQQQRLLSTSVNESNETNFYVPGVEVKVHYNSETKDTNSPNTPKTPNPTNIPNIQVDSPGGGNLYKSVSSELNRACVYTWFSIQSLPEMVISPCFLDYMEQTLANLPSTFVVGELTNVSVSDNDTDSYGNPVEAFNTTLASLPVDVVVYVHVHPSHVSFNCQPMSRVECLLHIPNLDLVFSSIRDNVNNATLASSFSFVDKGMADSIAASFPSGLSFTAVMSDFSVYVFHPYGTQQQQQQGGFMDNNKVGSGRNDSLSIDLEVVKINIVRTRKGNNSMDFNMSVSSKPRENLVSINISALVDIGKASFKYDMRRLSEILAFPRAWYRKSIARRLFFGDTSEMSAKPKVELEQDIRRPRSTTKHETGIFSFLAEESPMTSSGKAKTQTTQPDGVSMTSTEASWQGVVLFGLSMSRLDVAMNMSNVMGNTVWSCDGLKSNGRLYMQSTGDKDIFLSCGLDNSQLHAKSGIIGGNIELKNMNANCHLLEPSMGQPMHKVTIKLNSLGGRIEYMGGCVMMGRLTNVDIKLGDEWEGPKLNTPTSVEKSAVYVPGDIGWEDFSLIITRSTTPDVIKMLAKLQEFFTQQLQNSYRAFYSLRTLAGGREAPVKQPSVTSQVIYSHHRHWPTVYSAINDTFRSLGAAVTPQFHLGGSICLRGNSLTVVCFHGANFRSVYWFLFNILEPNIVFSTEVQEIKESIRGDESSTLATQSLTFNLGHDYWLKTGGPTTDPMATVSRVTRSRHQNPPPSSASLDEWFAYVTASHSQELTMLRTLNAINEPEAAGSNPGQSRAGSSSSYSHDTDIIFALPKLQLDFKTEHVQGSTSPDPEDKENRPVVECSFVTEFTDHICVTMDVELIMCLHDLITSYMKEKQQALSSRTRMASGQSSQQDSFTFDRVDLREFVCNTWQLEPTVRLISWAGRRIEPVGVDYILQKLGFRHARTTIPKWFQRGVLDVLDHALAVIVQNLVVTVTQQKKRGNK